MPTVFHVHSVLKVFTDCQLNISQVVAQACDGCSVIPSYESSLHAKDEALVENRGFDFRSWPATPRALLWFPFFSAEECRSRCKLDHSLPIPGTRNLLNTNQKVSGRGPGDEKLKGNKTKNLVRMYISSL